MDYSSLLWKLLPKTYKDGSNTDENDSLEV